MLCLHILKRTSIISKLKAIQPISLSLIQYRTLDKFSVKLIICFTLIFQIINTTALAYKSNTDFWSFQFENDLWGNREDRYYTNGFEVNLSYTEPDPSLLQRVSNALPFYHSSDKSIHRFGIGQKIFTPEDLSQFDVIENDRPYAGWLFIETGISHIYVNKNGQETVNGLLFNIGIIGPSSFAEEIQQTTHHLFDSQKPNGWDNQLKNELGINVLYIRKWRDIIQLENMKQIEFSHHHNLMLGNVYTYASTGVMLRWGANLHNDIGPPSISPGFPGIPAFNTSGAKNNWYFFSGIELRAMARNIFLDGNTLQDSHSVDKELVVGDLQIGFAFYYKNMRFSYSNSLRSKEFKDQVNNTQYGAINITVYSGD